MQKPMKLCRYLGIILMLGLAIPGLVATSSLAAGMDGSMIRARELAAEKDFEGALTIYESILGDDPGNLDALSGKGKVLAWMGKYESARVVFREVLEIEPHHLDAQTGLADTYAWEWNYVKAINIMEEELQRMPREREILIRLARYNRWAGNRGKAIEYTNRLLQFYPGDKEAEEIADRVSSAVRYEATFGYYFLNINNRVDGQNLYGGLKYLGGRNYTLYGRLDYLDRFRESEGKVTAGGSYKLSKKLQLAAELGLSPGSEVYPRYNGWLELASPAMPGWVIYGNMSFSSFKDADVVGFALAGEFYPYGHISLFGRASLVRTEFDGGGDSTDGALFLKATWFVMDENSINMYFGAGNEAFKDATVDTIGDIEAKILGVGGTYFFMKNAGISPSFEYQDRSGGTRYYQFGLELTYRY